MTADRLIITIAALALLAATASGCGRRGDLDTPYDAAVQAREDAKDAGQPVPPEPEKPETNKPFILDPLID
jgi:predicted small lipoprotein YifL